MFVAKVIARRFWILFVAGLLPCALLQHAAAQTAAASQGRLVSVDWLKQNLARADVLVLDASPAPLHRKQHIPGAVVADIFTFGPREVPPAQMEARMRSWGLSPGQQVVIVDQGGTYMATRLFWELLHYGLPAQSLFILDGGMARWTSAGGAVTDQPTPPRPTGTVRVTAQVHDVRVKLPEFLAATADPQRHVMLEALDPEYFYGGAAFFSRGGHVPHATLMLADDFYNADKTFKSPQEIQRMLDHLGIRPDQEVLTYCGGGGAAAVPFFALKFMLGYPRVRLFQESQLGWLQDSRDLPLWTYANPHLTRETDWLKAWGGRMLKSFGLSQVTVVDVRSADSFKLGHVPLAVNVPVQGFLAHADQPDRLAAQLGAAGLDATHEAVVFSDGGLNESAALAFLMLERVGQHKVSIHLDSLDRWVDRGLDVARPAAAGAAPARSLVYSPRPREHVLLSDAVNAANAPGLMPTVYVASGASLPARQPPGPVIHLPHGQFLDADGGPKAAKDIWTAMAKAGLPRYARIVLLADRLGEAAVNYVVLRMMGFADIKVQLP
ncbi:MAG: rhodanese-like domain-containing protein [Rubrivivax sp.]|nr:rhodanese-like domain-containing protein [Rubrivivax sp.]